MQSKNTTQIVRDAARVLMASQKTALDIYMWARTLINEGLMTEDAGGDQDLKDSLLNGEYEQRVKNPYYQEGYKVGLRAGMRLPPDREDMGG